MAEEKSFEEKKTQEERVPVGQAPDDKIPETGVSGRKIHQGSVSGSGIPEDGASHKDISMDCTPDSEIPEDGRLKGRPESSREKKIVRTSIVGIVANVLLAVFKFIAGSVSGSVSITLDAVNNLSDSLSSIITILGTKLGAKPADKKHPYGYGRTEYLSASIISAIVLYAGITSLKESVDKIIHPEPASYGTLAFTILVVGILVKILLSRYVKAVGSKTDSKALIASGSDAGFDAILSTSVLAAAVIFQVTGLSLEAYVGIAISVIILKSGIEMLKDALDDILGTRVDAALSKKIKEIVESHEGVYGAHDLFLHSYGPSRMEGSVHVEVPDTMTAVQIDALTHEIAIDVFRQCGVILTAVGVYSRNTQDPEITKLQNEIRAYLQSYPNFVEMHGFYVDREKKFLKFDVILSFDAKEEQRMAEYREICEKVRTMAPGYEVLINLDSDVSD